VKRIDAHQHYWSVARGDYGWLTPRDAVLYRDFAPEDLSGLLAECEVGSTVLVQAAATEAETRFLFDLARRHSSVAGVVGWVDFEGKDVRERVRNLVRDGDGKLKGLRPMIQDIDDPRWLDRPTLDAAFAAVEANALVFDALVKPRHLQALTRRLHRHPALKAVLDHGGKPDIAAGGFDAWSAEIGELARTTTIHCKLSGLLTEARPEAGIAELDPYVGRIFECFGAQRVLWGSDWPVLTLRASYRRWLELSLELVRRHAPRHVEAVFAANAAELYGLQRGLQREVIECP
jgi:L-fuconolactonase